jgi:hypothetical protein
MHRRRVTYVVLAEYRGRNRSMLLLRRDGAYQLITAISQSDVTGCGRR